jgi:hypothetical protein
MPCEYIRVSQLTSSVYIHFPSALPGNQLRIETGIGWIISIEDCTHAQAWSTEEKAEKEREKGSTTIARHNKRAISINFILEKMLLWEKVNEKEK